MLSLCFETRIWDGSFPTLEKMIFTDLHSLPFLCWDGESPGRDAIKMPQIWCLKLQWRCCGDGKLEEESILVGAVAVAAAGTGHLCLSCCGGEGNMGNSFGSSRHLGFKKLVELEKTEKNTPCFFLPRREHMQSWYICCQVLDTCIFVVFLNISPWVLDSKDPRSGVAAGPFAIASWRVLRWGPWDHTGKRPSSWWNKQHQFEML